MAQQSIFDRYGGFAFVSRVVSDYYERVVASPILAPYFDDIDMRRLIDHQTKFIASVMGGPASFSDENLERVHAHLDVDSAAFDEMALLLKETLEDYGFEASDVSHVYGDIVARRHLIVKRHA